jgi:lipoprotein-anchoring transpeptidase ErfK/SrfK
LLASPVARASAASAVSATSSTPAAPASLPRVTVLSNETTYTRWALANYSAWIRAQPSTRARALAKLRVGTPDGLGLQTYLLLSEQTTSSGAWVKLRVPGRPNGRIGWVQRGALDDFQIVHTELVLNRAARLLTLYRNGKAIFRAPVGVGKPSTPTPPGHFWVTEAFPSTDPAYGPYAFGTTDYSALSDWPGGGVVGLHGTNEPALVPGAPSHGCIRLHNSDILRLKNLVPIGTPIWVQ